MRKQTNAQVVILGAGYGGLLAAQRLAGKTRGLKPRITLVNASDQFVERIRMHQLAADEPLPTRSIPRLLRGTGVTLVQGYARALDAEARTLTVETETGVQTLAYDMLVYTPGSTTERDRVPGVREHAYLMTASGDQSAAALRDLLPDLAARGGTVLVCGGGLTGIEAATELAEAYPGLRVQLATQGALNPNLSRRGEQHLRAVLGRLGVDVFEQTTISRVTANAAHTSDGRTLGFDACVWAGAFVAPALAREAGLAVNGRNQVLVDAYHRSISHPDIYAAGDAAYHADMPFIRMGCAVAMPMSANAADNVAARLQGRAETPFRFSYLFRCISLGRRDGLIQFVNADDSPVERVLTGRVGAAFKEFICRFAYLSIPMEKRLPGFYLWPKGLSGQAREASITRAMSRS